MRRCALLTVAAICLGGCEVSFSADNVSVGQVKGNVSTSAPATTRTFVNSRDTARSAPLQQYYVDFSFDYPNHWTITPQPNDGSAQNFVRVAAPLLDGYEPFAVHVGYAYGSGDATADLAMTRTCPPSATRDRTRRPKSCKRPSRSAASSTAPGCGKLGSVLRSNAS